MKKSKLSDSFVVGVIALVFLIIGYQTALFIYNASVARIVANRDEPDTVYVYMPYPSDGEPLKVASGPDGSGMKPGQGSPLRRDASHDTFAGRVRQNMPARRVESFRFNPNEATHEELCRLGFSPKQASSIINYRQKGGRFRRKGDFARSFVVSDSIYRRLEPYIDIPLLDLNKADSAAFDALPGIGGWYAARMVEYRKKLGGYSYKEQLMDIWKFDRDKFDALSDLVTLSGSGVRPYPLWSLPADSLRLHPYIRNWETARAIVLYRDNTPREFWSVDSLASAGILSSESASKLSRCVIAGVP